VRKAVERGLRKQPRQQDYLSSQPSDPKLAADRVLAASRLAERSAERAPAQPVAKEPFPRAKGGQWSRYNKSGAGEIEVLLGKDGQPTTCHPHIHVVHDEKKGEVRMHVTEGSRGSSQLTHRIVLKGNVGGNTVNKVLKMGGRGRLLLRVGGRAGCRRRLLTVLAADRWCRLAAGGAFGGVRADGCGSGGLGVEGGDAEEVVDGGGDLEPGSVAFSASEAELSSAGDGLDPCEGFLDRLLADR
jgi:hypothetical protein